jgi:hypothetical protein
VLCKRTKSYYGICKTEIPRTPKYWSSDTTLPERGATGDRARSLIELELVLHDMRQVYGPDHPNTLSCRSGVAGLRYETATWPGVLMSSKSCFEIRCGYLNRTTRKSSRPGETSHP